MREDLSITTDFVKRSVMQVCVGDCWEGPSRREFMHRSSWTEWGWWMPFHGIPCLMFLVLLIVGVVVAVRAMLGAGRHPWRSRGRPAGIDILE
jgi:hypothetical protein